MSRALIVLWNAADREKVSRWASKAPPGTRVEFKATKRSLPANDRLWAMLTEVAAQVPWHGVKLSAADYKLIFLDALKKELRIVPNLDGDGFVNLGRSSSDLSKEEFSDLLALIEAWGAKHHVQFNDPKGSRRMTEELLGDAPIDPKYRELMNDLAADLDTLFNPGLGAERMVGFVLLVFPFGDNEGLVNYISNADRADVVTMLREQLARFEGQSKEHP